MQSFKEFISETPMEFDWDKKDVQSNLVTSFKVLKLQSKDSTFHKIARTPQGHELWREDHELYPNEPTYHAVKNGLVHKSVNGVQHGNHFHVDTLVGAEGSDYKAHQFYHDLIHHGGLDRITSSDVQSPGSMKAWKNLSRMKDINMRHVHQGQEIPLNKANWVDNYGWDSRFEASKK